MKIKNLFGYVVFAVVVVLILSTFLHIDRAEPESTIENSSVGKQSNLISPPDYESVEINSREYRQARGNVGKYGGTFNDSLAL